MLKKYSHQNPCLRDLENIDVIVGETLCQALSENAKITNHKSKKSIEEQAL